MPRLLPAAPEELTSGRLRRLGEGLGRVVYASDHWVVKRERSLSGIFALIVVWKILTRVARILPGRLGEPLLRHPSRWIRLLRVAVQAVVSVVPRNIWLMTHSGELWRRHLWHDVRGRHLAQAYLSGTSLVPERVIFPSVRVGVRGWPGWLVVNEATERVEGTLYQRISDLSRAGRFEELEMWLERFLDLRQAGWRRGLFSVDAHLKNYGVAGDRVVLLDTGGLTDHWPEVSDRLSAEQVVAEPHGRLGMGPLLASCPDVAKRFDARWREVVSHETVQRHWPSGDSPP
jgi:hypothetical protein